MTPNQIMGMKLFEVRNLVMKSGFRLQELLEQNKNFKDKLQRCANQVQIVDS